MLSAVRAYLRVHAIRGPAEILVACSGGPDSTALACALQVCGPASGLTVALAYLDHAMRDAAERAQEREAVEALSGILAVPLVTGALEPGRVAERVRSRRESPEEAAREERYAYLDRVRTERGSTWVALGHTADDFAETMIMRVLQGVGVSGLGGIPERRDPWIRPLIRATRQEVIEYLRRRNVPWVEDTTNRDPRYLRNRIRTRIIPVVAEVFPEYRNALRELGRKAASVERHLRDTASSSVVWVKTDRGLHTSWAAYRRTPGVVRIAAVLHALDTLGARRIPHRHLETLGRSHDATRTGVLLSGRGYRVERRRDRLWVLPDIVRNARIGYLVHVGGPGRYVVPRHDIVVDVAPEPWTHREARSPVVVRSRRPGDFMRLRGRAESLEKIADRCRVPSAVRSVLPIVADPNGLRRVLGSAVGGRNLAVGPERDATAIDAGISVRVSREEF